MGTWSSDASPAGRPPTHTRSANDQEVVQILPTLDTGTSTVSARLRHKRIPSSQEEKVMATKKVKAKARAKEAKRKEEEKAALEQQLPRNLHPPRSLHHPRHPFHQHPRLQHTR